MSKPGSLEELSRNPILQILVLTVQFLVVKVAFGFNTPQQRSIVYGVNLY